MQGQYFHHKEKYNILAEHRRFTACFSPLLEFGPFILALAENSLVGIETSLEIPGSLVLPCLEGRRKSSLNKNCRVVSCSPVR